MTTTFQALARGRRSPTTPPALSTPTPVANGWPLVAQRSSEYLSTQGGDMHGNIRMDFDKCIDGRNADGQNYRFLQFKGGQGLEYKAATNNEYNVINRKALEADLDSYLPLTGGDLSGQLNIKANSGVCLSVNTNKVKFWSSGAVELNGYTAFKDNELVTKAYTDQAIKDAVADAPPTSSPFRKYKYAGDRTWGNMRPGEFQLLEQGPDITNELDKCAAIIFKGEDADGMSRAR